MAGDLSKMRHDSPEGGLDTVGFGHKLTEQEDASGEIYGLPIDELTWDQADAILRMDMYQKFSELADVLEKDYDTDISSLSQRQKAMLLDYQYNLRGGVNSFPNFTRAVLSGDEAAQKKEMTRYYYEGDDKERLNPKPLARNRAFYNAFMSDKAKKFYGE